MVSMAPLAERLHRKLKKQRTPTSSQIYAQQNLGPTTKPMPGSSKYEPLVVKVTMLRAALRGSWGTITHARGTGTLGMLSRSLEARAAASPPCMSPKPAPISRGVHLEEARRGPQMPAEARRCRRRPQEDPKRSESLKTPQEARRGLNPAVERSGCWHTGCILKEYVAAVRSRRSGSCLVGGVAALHTS